MTTKLSKSEQIAYGIGDISNGLAIASTGFWLLIYLTDAVGLNPAYAGFAMMVGRFWDAVTDPIMGWIVDRTKTRWGRRRPYLFFGALAYALSFILIWSIPEFSSQFLTALYVCAVFILFNTCFTVVFLPYTSLTAALTNDYNERITLTGIRMICSQIAFLIGAALPIAIVTWITKGNGVAWLDSFGLNTIFGSWIGDARQGYLLMALGFSAVMLISIWITFFFGSNERVITKPSGIKSPWSYIMGAIKALTQNIPYQRAVLIILFSNCAASFIAVNLPYYLQYVVGRAPDKQTIITILFLAAILALPFWILVARRWGKSESYWVAMSLYIPVIISLIFLNHSTSYLLFGIAVLAGILHAAALMIPWSMIPDVVDYDQLKSGVRREGLLYSGTTFSYKMATGLALFLSGVLLHWFGYIPDQEQSELSLNGIRISVSVIPVIFLVTAIIVARKYPLTQKAHQEVLARLNLENNEKDKDIQL